MEYKYNPLTGEIDVVAVETPATSVDGNFVAFDGTTGDKLKDGGFKTSGTAKLTVSATEPSTPATGDLWVDTS